MKKNIILLIVLVLNLQASIKDECYYMKPNEMGAKCKAGEKGESAGYGYVSYLMNKHGSRKWVDYIGTQQLTSEFSGLCNSRKGDGLSHKDYYFQRCMEILNETREHTRRR